MLLWVLLALHIPSASGSPAPYAAVGLGLAVLATVLVVAVAAAAGRLGRPGAARLVRGGACPYSRLPHAPPQRPRRRRAAAAASTRFASRGDLSTPPLHCLTA